MKYKFGKDETVVNTFLVDSKPRMIITRCTDNSFIIYCIKKNGEIKKIGKGNNPSVLEDKFIDKIKRGDYDDK